jgi:thioredoxin 1
MKKTTLLTLIVAITPIIIFSLFAQEIGTKKPIYLHQQQKGVHSSSEHLNEFASTGCVILDFYADWCNPCKRMSPLIDMAAANLPQFTFIKINRDFFMDLAKAFNITSIPTLIFLRDGKEIGRYDGGPLTQNSLEQLVCNKYHQ